MAPLPRAGRGLVRRWIRRAMAGYWTHAGYMNWDSGLGFERWHQAKKLGLAQQALIGIAQTPRLQPGREWGRWAKWELDRGLRFYERLPVREGGAARPGALPALHGPADGRQRAARRGAAAGQRRARGRGRARADGAASGRRRCTPTTPTSAVSRSRRRRTTRRSSRSTSARSRTAGSSSRGCSTASRTSPPTSAAARPPRSACSCASRAGGACSPRRPAARPPTRA